MRWNSFRVRLSLWNVGVLAVVLVGLGLTLSWVIQANVATALDRDLTRQMHGSRRFIASSAPGRASRSRSGGRSFGSRRRPRPYSWNGQGVDSNSAHLFFVRRPRFYDLTGHESALRGGGQPWDVEAFKQSMAGRTVYSSFFLTGDHLRQVSAPVSRNGRIIGVIQQATELSELDRLHQSLLHTLLVIIPLGVLVAGIGGLFLTGRALRPVHEVTAAASQISTDDLSRRLPVWGNDELAELSSTFNQMLDRLERAFRDQKAAMDQLRQFTADVSHELRTPLTRLTGAATLALAGPPQLDGYRAALQTVEQAADWMNRLVQDLLLLARSDAGQLLPQFRPHDVETVLAESADSVSVPEGIRLQVQPPSLPTSLWADEGHLIRMLTNLVENALRHTRPGGTVTLAAATEAGTVAFRVSDDGEGIAPEHLPHLFERFYRVDPARERSRGGCGLGLSIARSIVVNHGGTIRIESEVGRGTEVTVELPREPILEEPAAFPEASLALPVPV